MIGNSIGFKNEILTLATNFSQIGVDEFRGEIERGEAILIDVRPQSEQDKYGVISNNQSQVVFGSADFAKEILDLDRAKKYLIYCWHGQRSAVTRDFMQENGFTWVKDLKGGIDDWNKAKKEFVN